MHGCHSKSFVVRIKLGYNVRIKICIYLSQKFYKVHAIFRTINKRYRVELLRINRFFKRFNNLYSNRKILQHHLTNTFFFYQAISKIIQKMERNFSL